MIHGLARGFYQSQSVARSVDSSHSLCPEIFAQLFSEILALQSGRRMSTSADFTLEHGDSYEEATRNGFFCVPPLRGPNAAG